MTDNIGFIYQADIEAKRQAFRTSLPGLTARLSVTGDSLPVRDISAGGLSMDDVKERFAVGDQMELDLFIKDKLIIAGLKVQIARRAGQQTGLRFLDLDLRQEQRLDKLVLEIQKFMISKGKNIDGENET
jgi:c-di-GMP-binding flagellar brake protein YcgR